MEKQPPRLFDRRAIARARERASRIGGDAFLLHEATEGILHRLSSVNRQFERALAVDATRPLPEMLDKRAQNWALATIEDNEALGAEPQSFDLAVSILSLHAVNDLPGLLHQIRRALKPDGLFLAAMFGGSTLTELRQSLASAEIDIKGGVSPHVAPFADVRDLGSLLQRAGFALPVADSERTVVRYREFSRLIQDLRALGETNVLSERRRVPLMRAVRDAAIAHYRDRYAESDGRLRATFDIVYLTGWAPHDSQQKPLMPGSAMTRLADALGVTEFPAGDAVPKPRRD